MFETVDHSMPSNWGAKVSGEGFLSIGPQNWLEDGFWERYFDDDARAVNLFERELSTTLAES
ncbi:hypothetical protein [Kribbella antiqua]|nr:hypothetical protein [Kribbella antiqua]